MSELARQADIIPLWRVKAKRGLDHRLITYLETGRELPYGRDLVTFYAMVDTMGPEYRAYMGLIDRYYLLLCLLHRVDVLKHADKGNKWLFERCREVEAYPDDHLDLWGRNHYKSTLITFAGAIQEILRDPEITIGIFSHSAKISRKFLWQIMLELETNDELKVIYPTVLWWEPKREAPRWSLSEGIVVKRRSNPGEATVEAWGLVDGQPTAKHYMLRIYDDVWTRDNVTTADQIKKTLEARELSENLGRRDGRQWNIGTRYSYADGYGTMLDRSVFKARVYPATSNGLLSGVPVFLTPEEWEAIKRKQPSQVPAQLLQNPLAGQDQMFDAATFKGYMARPRTLNVYITCDPSKGAPNRRSDRTAIAVIGVDAAGNKYLLDGYRHRMRLPARWVALKTLHKKWSAAAGVMTVSVGYERYGMQSDVEYFEERQRAEGYPFTITELSWTQDHTRSKEDRVERLLPDIKSSSFFMPAVVWNDGERCEWVYDAEQKRIIYRPLKSAPHIWEQMATIGQPFRCAKPIKRVDEEGQVYDLTVALQEELAYFPFGVHDDLCDAASRIYDMEPIPPTVLSAADLEPTAYVDT